MLRRSHLLVSLFICLMIASHFIPIGSSQSTSRSLLLNGTSQYLTAPSSTSLNITGAITVEAWDQTELDWRVPNRPQSRGIRTGRNRRWLSTHDH